MATDLPQATPPLPSLFPPSPGLTTVIPPSSDPSEPLDLSSAPRGRRTPWPWRYVTDMAAGFAAMRKLEDVERMGTAAAFHEVFQAPFKQSTFNDQMRAWRAAGSKPGERERWIAAGRTDQGEWLRFMKVWRQK